MSLRRYAAKRDLGEGEIVQALRKSGCHVRYLSGAGLPDLLVLTTDGRVVLLEVKGPRGKLTPEQEAFISCGWPVTIVHTPEEALGAVEPVYDRRIPGPESSPR